MGRVLILDGMWNKSLAAVRSFGRRGFFVAAGERTRFSTALFSRFCQRRLVYPSPLENPEGFLEYLESELKRYRYDAIFPMELSTQRIVTSAKDRLSRYCRIPFADPDLMEKIHDKAFLMRYAKERGFDVPETHIIEDLSQIDGVAGSLQYPVVIKPRHSSGSRGIVYVKNRDEFIDAYLAVHGKYPFPIIQEYIPRGGDAIGVCLLLNFDSRVRASFVYKRLREYPLEGGPSTLRVSIKRDDLKEKAISLLEGLGWKGVAHVEYRIDPRDGKARLLEVNPRFWGSLNLAIESGVDFPYLLYRLAMDGDITPVHDYKTGVMCRWLLPGDLLHFLANPERFKLNPGFLDMTIKDDIISLRDPLPLLGRILSIFPFLYHNDLRGVLQR